MLLRCARRLDEQRSARRAEQLRAEETRVEHGSLSGGTVDEGVLGRPRRTRQPESPTLSPESTP